MSTSTLTRSTTAPTAARPTSVLRDRAVPRVGTFTGTPSALGSYTGTAGVVGRVVGSYTGTPATTGSYVRTER